MPPAGIPVVLATLLILSGACSNTVGPRALRGGQRDYNDAIQLASSEQLLKNIVRLRFDEMPHFLEIRQINTSYENLVGLDAGVSFTKPFQANTGTVVDSTIPRSDFGGKWEFRERPTITYAPLVGQKFADEYLTPIGQETLLKLYYSGWPIDRILRLCVQEMKGIKNAPSASGPAPRRAPEYQRFQEVCNVLQEMQDHDLLAMTVGKSANEPVAILEIGADPGEERLDERLRILLGLEDDARHIILTRRIATNPSEITITPRTVMGVLFYLSQGVAVPESHASKGTVMVTRNDNGSAFDWDLMLGGLFRVACSRDLPAEAAVATRRGHWWYWIAADDIDAKRTFHFVSQLITLSGGKFDSPAPILTVPVR